LLHNLSATCCSIFLYVDDILLIAPSVSALQIVFHACEEELLAIDMYVNKKKTMYIRFGRRYNEQCAELVTADGGHLTLLKVNVEISTFRGRPQAQPRGRNISSSVTGRFVLPL